MSSAERDAPPEEPAIRFSGVSKNYGDFAALNDVSFDVPHGEVTALLGPNGAGKSSLIDILGGVLTPTAGEVTVLGATVRGPGSVPPGTMGIMLQDAGFIPELTVEQTVRSWSAFHRGSPGDVLDRVDLADKAGTRVGTLSGGEKRRLELALAIMGPPDIVVLDEPTTGMDLDSRHRAVALIGELVRAGTTVILTTHLLEEAQQLADSVVILRNGSVALQCRSADQTGSETHIQFLVRRDDRQRLADSLPDVVITADRKANDTATPDDRTLATIVTADSQQTLYRLLSEAHAIDAPIESLRVRPQTIEDLYIAATLDDSEESWSR